MAKRKSKVVEKPLTRDEQIQYELGRKQSDYLKTTSDDLFVIIPDVPPSRFLKVGDKVEVGNLTDCVVCFVTLDQKFVVIDYIRVDENYGNPIKTPDIGCWPWYDVIPLTNIKTTKLMMTDCSLRHSLITTGISGLLMKVLYFGVNPTPEFQRDYVWTPQDEENLIDSVFNSRDIGKFVFLKYPYPKDMDILDGKQRLNTLVRFTTSMFPYKGYYWHEIGRLDRHQFEDHTIQYAEIDASKMTEADKCRLFLNVNAAGVPQSEDHILKIKRKLAELTK